MSKILGTFGFRSRCGKDDRTINFIVNFVNLSVVQGLELVRDFSRRILLSQKSLGEVVGRNFIGL
jgi:hypothetical protein